MFTTPKMIFACICLANVEGHAAKSEANVFCGGHAPALIQSAPSYGIYAHAAEKAFGSPNEADTMAHVTSLGDGIQQAASLAVIHLQTKICHYWRDVCDDINVHDGHVVGSD